MRGLLRLQMREDKHLGALRRLMPLTEEFRRPPSPPIVF
jgi:hypothetical protein